MDINEYITTLDSADKTMIKNNVSEIGIEEYLSRKLVYMDCSRIINGMRMMQTIGYPYQREITSYLYALENEVNFMTVENSDVSKFNKQEWIDKLLEVHKANLEYEKENPPFWYGGKKAKAKWDREHNKLPRRKKVSESTIPGFAKELSNTERLKRLSANFGKLNFTIKTFNKNG